MSKAFTTTVLRAARTFLVLPLFAFSISGFAVPSVAHAIPFTYTYIGNSFNETMAPYTSSDFVRGTFTFDAPTNFDLPLGDYTPLVTSFRFTDGQQTLTDASSLALTAIEFQTDILGNVELWSVFLVVRESAGFPVQGIFTANLPGTSVLDVGALDTQERGAIVLAPGRWTQSIPEPGTFYLLGLAAFAITWRARRSGTSRSELRSGQP